jgi:uncharacterized membrane-anchored protein
MEQYLRAGLRKVPEVTALFWVVKILTTAFGESASDYLVRVIDPVVAVGIGAGALFVALVFQFWVPKYYAWVYWFAVAMVAVFGTMAADVLHIGLGIPYLYSTIFFAVALVIIFVLWHTTEGTLSIHSITTSRRELFYWGTVITTFALGTAAGDMTASTLGLGYLVSGILFAVLIILVALIYRYQLRNEVLAFWLAYVLTRPLGASFADWMGKAHSLGGLGWGDGTVSIALAILIICCVGYLAAA